MAGRTTIIIQGTAWGVQETQSGKRFLRVSVTPGYRDRNGNWQSSRNSTIRCGLQATRISTPCSTRFRSCGRIRTSSWT